MTKINSTQYQTSSKRALPALLLGAAACIVPVCIWMFEFRGPAVERANSDQRPPHSPQPDEILQLHQEIRVLRGQVAATQLLVASERLAANEERDAATASGTAAATEPHAHVRSDEELRRDMRELLDQKLAHTLATRSERRAAEAAVLDDLTPALGGAARVADVACDELFCKITVEQDRKQGALPLDLGGIAQNSKSLKHETVFEYEFTGETQRVVMYAAREGHLLPVPRGVGSP